MSSSSLSHHGILGQKWGVRRYQNDDGSLTDEGKRRANKLYTFDQDPAKYYTKDFIDFCNTPEILGKSGIKGCDDYELLELVEMEYEELLNKNPRLKHSEVTIPNDFIIVMDKFGGAHLEHKNGFKYLSKQYINGKWHYVYNTLSAKVRGYSKEGNLKDRGYSSSTSGTNTNNLRDRGYSNSRGISNTYLYEGVYNKNALRKQGYSSSHTGGEGASLSERRNRDSLRNKGYSSSRDGSQGSQLSALNRRSDIYEKARKGASIIENLLKKLKKSK